MLAVAPVSAHASAAADKSKAAAAPVGSQRFCAIDLQRTERSQCFGTARDAISRATAGGATTLNAAAATGAAKLTAHAAKAHASAAGASYLIGIAHYYENFGSPTLYFYG